MGCANTDAGVQQLLLELTVKLDPGDDCFVDISGSGKFTCLRAACLPTWINRMQDGLPLGFC